MSHFSHSAYKETHFWRSEPSVLQQTLLKWFKMHSFFNADGWIWSKKDLSSLHHLPSCIVLCSSGNNCCVPCRAFTRCCFRVLFHLQHQAFWGCPGTFQPPRRQCSGYQWGRPVGRHGYCQTRTCITIKPQREDEENLNNSQCHEERKETEMGFIHCFKSVL